MVISWENIGDSDKYVHEILALEAADIPVEVINAGKWFSDEIDLSTIMVDQNMLENHDKDPVHIKRRDDFIKSFNKKVEIKPLIVLGERLILVDGYARFRALKKIGVKMAKVLRQKIK